MISAMCGRAEPILLDDARMQHFIDRGHLTLQSALPRTYHDELCATLERVIAAEGNPGNNLLPRIPQIARILDDPHVTGGLTSILGPGYTMHAHRYCHVNTPGRKPTRPASTPTARRTSFTATAGRCCSTTRRTRRASWGRPASCRAASFTPSGRTRFP